MATRITWIAFKRIDRYLLSYKCRTKSKCYNLAAGNAKSPSSYVNPWSRSPKPLRCEHESDASMKATEAFLTDVKELRTRARASIEKGPLTPDYQGDVK